MVRVGNDSMRGGGYGYNCLQMNSLQVYGLQLFLNEFSLTPPPDTIPCPLNSSHFTSKWPVNTCHIGGAVSESVKWTDRRMDISECRVAFATEKTK